MTVFLVHPFDCAQMTHRTPNHREYAENEGYISPLYKRVEPQVCHLCMNKGLHLITPSQLRHSCVIPPTAPTGRVFTRQAAGAFLQPSSERKEP